MPDSRIPGSGPGQAGTGQASLHDIHRDRRHDRGNMHNTDRYRTGLQVEPPAEIFCNATHGFYANLELCVIFTGIRLTRQIILS